MHMPNNFGPTLDTLETQSGSVVVVGDAMLDVKYDAEVKRVSPDAPILDIRVSDKAFLKPQQTLGGAGNVAANTAKLNQKTTLLTVHGDDPHGKSLASCLERGQIANRAIIEPGRLTCAKTRFFAQGRAVAGRISTGSEHPITQASVQQLLANADRAIAEADVLILSDYGKGALTEEIILKLIEKANKRGIPVLVDSKRNPLTPFKNVFLLKPNLDELHKATQMPINSPDEIEAAARKLQTDYNIEHILVTQSEKGMGLYSKNAAAKLFPAAGKDVYDVSGAGDTVIATVGSVLAASKQKDAGTLEKAVQLSTVAAGITIEKAGVVPISLGELKKKHHCLFPKKVLTQKELLEQVDILRLQNPDVRVGFTNGVYDIVHTGHTQYLAECKKNCDILIVGVNSDDSVHLLGKGSERPYITHAQRADVIASVQGVDYATIFNEKTPVALLKAIKPNVLFKGDDYTKSQVVGASEVESWGGEVLIIPSAAANRGPKPQSTTLIVEKIKKNGNGYPDVDIGGGL